jgi:hypothetical protein
MMRFFSVLLPLQTVVENLTPGLSVKDRIDVSPTELFERSNLYFQGFSTLHQQQGRPGAQRRPA